MLKEGNRAEEALTSSEQELRLLVEAIPTLVWRAAPEGNIDYVNKRVLDYLGAPLSEVIGWGWMDKVHPDDVAFKVRTWLKNLESGNPHDVVCRFRGADGRYRWFEVRGEPLRAGDGAVLGWSGVLIDIDDRRKADDALRESEYKLRQIIDTVPGLIWSTGPDGEPTHISQRLLDYGGMRFEEFKRVGWETFVHPNDFPETAKTYDHAIHTGTSYQGVLRLRRADGEFRWHHARCEPLRDRQGRIIQWYGLSVDIDERKNAEERLRLSETRLAEAQRLSHSGVAAYNETTILYGSVETHRIWGFDPAQGIPGREAVNQRIHPDDRDRVLAEVQRAVGEKRDYSIGYRIVLPDGTAKHLESIGRPRFSASGELVEIVVTHLDVTERKRAEEALRESEQRFRDYAEAASDWYWETDPDHKFTRITDYERLLALGFAPVRRIGLTRWDYATDVESEPEKWELHRFLLEARQPFRDFVYRAARSDGSLAFYKTSGKPIYDAKGAFLGYRGTGADVTAAMRAEAALQESEYKLRQIIEAVPGLVWSTGPDGEPNYVNQRLLDYTGTRLEDFKNRKWERFLHPDDVPEFAKAVDHAIETGTFFESVHRLRRSNGEYRWHHGRIEPLRDREGRIIQWYGLSVDIYEGKRAEDRLRRSEAHLAEAQRLSRTGSSVYSETAILYWSEEAFRIWGFDPQQGLPSREAMLQRIHPDDRDRYHKQTKDALREKRDCSIEFRIVLPDGTVKDVEKIYHPVFSTSGELVEIIASGIDVTERKRAEEEHERLRQLELDLAHMNRLSTMGELAASLAHEITQPIAAARNNARAALNFLDQQQPDLGEVGEALGYVVGDADRAGLIVDRIRDHIKKAPPRKHRFDLNEAINEVIVLARSAIAENGVSAQTRLTAGLAPVEGDCVQLQQVIMNLVLNAVEALSSVDEAVRELLISTEQSRTNGVLVAVRNSGPGIDPERIERIFDAFYTTKSNGMGMGLSICRSIIEAHGGRLWAVANQPRGAVFQFTLPGPERSS